MTDDEVEKKTQEKNLNAPRVTKQDLNDNIIDVEIVKHVSISGQVLRWAVLTTKCGFAAVGDPSVAVSLENDDVEIGIGIAIDNSKSKLWPLMGYALKQQLHLKDIQSQEVKP